MFCGARDDAASLGSVVCARMVSAKICCTSQCLVAGGDVELPASAWTIHVATDESSCGDFWKRSTVLEVEGCVRRLEPVR